MVGKGDFQVICRICNKPLKLGIDTAADEEGKALHETCYVKQITDAPRNPPAGLDARAKVCVSFQAHLRERNCRDRRLCLESIVPSCHPRN